MQHTEEYNDAEFHQFVTLNMDFFLELKIVVSESMNMKRLNYLSWYQRKLPEGCVSGIWTLSF